MKQEISDRFDLNIARVRNLVSIYRTQLSGPGKGRRGHQETDVLRAALVLLHASMEDVLRSLAYWKLPAAGPAVLERIAIVGGTNTKFHLGNLAAHRGKTVDEVIKESVDEASKGPTTTTATKSWGYWFPSGSTRLLFNTTCRVSKPQ